MMKRINENTKEIRITLLLPEDCEVLLEPVDEPDDDALEGVEEEICSYAIEAADELCNLLETEFLPDEAYGFFSALSDVVIHASAQTPLELIKLMFISADCVDGRKAINRAIELCGEDDALYELFLVELLDTEAIEKFVFNMFSELKESNKEE